MPVRSGQDPQGATSRETELRRSLRVDRGEGGHSRSQTGRCYCESVWWKWRPAIVDETKGSRNPTGVATGRGKRDPAIAE